MTQNDNDLIYKAWKLNPINWSHISDLIKQADTQEAKDMLHSIENNLYHREEYSADLL